MSIKEELLAAKQLIKIKRYNDARGILEGIDHPTAHKWLKKLDEIAPKKSRSGQRIKWALLVLGLIVIAVLLIQVILPLRQASREQANTITLTFYCEREASIRNLPENTCSTWVQETQREFAGIIETCRNTENFDQCMRENNLHP